MLNIEIRRNADGLTRIYQEDWAWDGDYIWSEGNFACDCNRALFFARAGSEDDPDDTPCSEELYSIRIKDDAGKILYDELDAAGQSPHAPPKDGN